MRFINVPHNIALLIPVFFMTQTKVLHLAVIDMTRLTLCLPFREVGEMRQCATRCIAISQAGWNVTILLICEHRRAHHVETTSGAARGSVCQIEGHHRQKVLYTQSSGTGLGCHSAVLAGFTMKSSQATLSPSPLRSYTWDPIKSIFVIKDFIPNFLCFWKCPILSVI